MSDAFGQHDQPAPAPGWTAPGVAAAAPVPAYPANPASPANPAHPGGFPAAPPVSTAYPQPDAFGQAPQAVPLLGEAPKNTPATWALVAGLAVIVILATTQYALASGLAIIVAVRGIRRATAIKRAGYPQAVGMTRSLIGLAFAAIGLAFYVLYATSGSGS